MNQLTIKLYDDGASNGAVRAPASYDAQYWNGSAWVDVLNQVHAQVMTSQVHVVFTRQPNYYVGVTELEAWYPAPAPNTYYHVVNQNSGKLLAVQNVSTASSAQFQQFNDTGTPDHNWQLINIGSGYFHSEVAKSLLYLTLTF